jgi:hypothetical protein
MEEEKRIKAREAWRNWYECNKKKEKERVLAYAKTENGRKVHRDATNKYRRKNKERVNELRRLRYQKKKQMKDEQG